MIALGSQLSHHYRHWTSGDKTAQIGAEPRGQEQAKESLHTEENVHGTDFSDPAQKGLQTNVIYVTMWAESIHLGENRLEREAWMRVPWLRL